MLKWLRRLFTRQPPEPEQLRLNFFEPYCGYSGLACVYRNEAGERYPGSGFYGKCWRCGVTYDPGCDR